VAMAPISLMDAPSNRLPLQARVTPDLEAFYGRKTHSAWPDGNRSGSNSCLPPRLGAAHGK